MTSDLGPDQTWARWGGLNKNKIPDLLAADIIIGLIGGGILAIITTAARTTGNDEKPQPKSINKQSYPPLHLLVSHRASRLQESIDQHNTDFHTPRLHFLHPAQLGI